MKDAAEWALIIHILYGFLGFLILMFVYAWVAIRRRCSGILKWYFRVSMSLCVLGGVLFLAPMLSNPLTDQSLTQQKHNIITGFVALFLMIFGCPMALHSIRLMRKHRNAEPDRRFRPLLGTYPLARMKGERVPDKDPGTMNEFHHPRDER